ncbi:hypothetical protein [[Clostridium] dakarense]|uniref:hypothetical protein n=1 Tax=Faecalimicrobium dakarense TaxID=1301100 RepID=UPI0004B707EF|nr:hypothetical protein [[Clostridium] dakarense]
MKHIKSIKLEPNDMNIIVGILDSMIIQHMIAASSNAYYYKDNVSEPRLVYFLQHDIETVKSRAVMEKFYDELNKKMKYINSKLKAVKLNYETVLREKKLRELRILFAKVNLTENELKSIPILLKCLDIECSNNIMFMIENELYIRNRVSNETKLGVKYENPNRFLNERRLTEQNEKLNDKVKELEENIKIKEEEITTLENRNKELKLELDFDYKQIGYYNELSKEDFGQVIKDLCEHSNKVKDKFKQLIEEFENREEHSDDKLYEMWMQWTEDEVTVIDRVLKKSIYGEKICIGDVNELEDMSENIMNRHLLSRLVLHFIYRRMSSQCIEEILT